MKLFLIFAVLTFPIAAQNPAGTDSVPGATANGLDIRAYGGRVFSTPSPIIVTTNGTSTVTTTGIADFQVGDGLVIGAGGIATTQTTPSAPTVQVIGANGSSTISYECAGLDQQWGMTAASAATSVTTAPAVFGLAAVQVSSATWAANVVTVNTSTSMPFSSGTFHVMISDITSGGNQIGGIRNATIVNATQLTYSLTGSGTVVVNTSSAVLFVNGFVLTQVAETAGSNQIVLTTDVNHNLQQQLSLSHPTKLFLDGINFSGEFPVNYADGEFTIASTTANTITVTTPHVAALTQNAVASVGSSTAGVATMSVLTWAEMLVTCPQNVDSSPATGGVQYAVYANYGSGYAPIGFTTYQHSIFIDYGPSFTKTGFTPPPAMNLPVAPPVSAQKQVFEGQIISISGSTLTLDRSVPQSLSGVNGYHSNGAALQNAVSASCQRNDGFTGQNTYPVYIPADSGLRQFYFNAPVDLSGGTNHCGVAAILDAGYIQANGTIYNSRGFTDWRKPEGGFTSYGSGTAGGQVSWSGSASPQLALTQAAYVKGMAFTTQISSQNAIYSSGPDSKFEHCSFTNGATYPDATPLILGGGGYQVRLRDIFFGGVPNIQTPLSGTCFPCGQVSFWPIPAIDVKGGPSNQPNLVWEGQNYGNGTGIQINQTDPGPAQGMGQLEIYNIETFQQPWQPFLQIYGDSGIATTHLEYVQMDSIPMPPVANINCSSCDELTIRQVQNTGSANPNLSGSSFRFVDEVLVGPYAPAQSVHDTSITQAGVQINATTFANLGTPSNFVIVGCSDCTIANPCASGGSGAIAKRLNGVWVCN